MKEYYENRSKTFLTRRTPVIIRNDGKNFGTYTKSLQKPFDEGLIEDMNETAIYLCKNIQGAKCAYVQSNEISILVTDFDDLSTDAWFDYNVQKMCSISSSLATGIFNQLRIRRNLLEKTEALYDLLNIDFQIRTDDINANKIGFHKSKVIQKVQQDFNELNLANFDSRCFNIPKEDVANYFLWRQQDCVRNSISSVAQSLYSHKELNGKNSKILQEMIFQKGINWNDFSNGEKRGRWIVKNTHIDDELMSLEQLKIILQYGYQNPSSSIKSKWEVVETPEKFNYSHFEFFLK